MKKSVIVLCLGFLLVMVGPVRAEEDSSVNADTYKEKRLQLKEAAKQSAQERKLKLQQLRDEKKKALTERLSKKMCELNKRKAANATKNLDKMSAILDKAVKRAAEAKSQGKDVSAFEAAVETARTMIAQAREAASSQAGAACDVVITGTDAALKSDVEKARLALQNGLEALNAKVVAARKAVSDAIVALATALGEPNPVKVTQ